MLISRLIAVIAGTSLVLNGLIIDSASAQNQSDVTGGNTSDVTGGNTSDITGGDALENGDVTGFVLGSEILQTANELADQLRDSISSRQPFSINRRNTLQRCNIRRFALGQPSGEQNESSRSCLAPRELSVSSDSTELNTLLETSKIFLDRVNQDIEETKAKINNRLW